MILRHILYLVYFCPCLGLGLFMSYLCDLCDIFIFSLIFIVIDHITSLKQTHLFRIHFVEYLLLILDDKVDEESEQFLNSKSSASGFCLALLDFLANFSVLLLINVLLIRKRVSIFSVQPPLKMFTYKHQGYISDICLKVEIN